MFPVCRSGLVLCVAVLFSASAVRAGDHKPTTAKPPGMMPGGFSKPGMMPGGFAKPGMMPGGFTKPGIMPGGFNKPGMMPGGFSKMPNRAGKPGKP